MLRKIKMLYAAVTGRKRLNKLTAETLRLKLRLAEIEREQKRLNRIYEPKKLPGNEDDESDFEVGPLGYFG